MNALNLIKELYDLYSDEEKTPQITEMVDKGSDIEDRQAGLYMDLQQQFLDGLTWDTRWDQQISHRVPARDTQSYGAQTRYTLYKQQT